jgi:hypothetical protein
VTESGQLSPGLDKSWWCIFANTLVESGSTPIKLDIVDRQYAGRIVSALNRAGCPASLVFELYRPSIAQGVQLLSSTSHAISPLPAKPGQYKQWWCSLAVLQRMLVICRLPVGLSIPGEIYAS